MKLYISRNQADVKGFFGGHKGVMFSLSARAEITPQEQGLIDRYKVSDYQLATYRIPGDDDEDEEKQRITVSSLLAGFTVQLRQLDTLMELEEKCKQSCRELKTLLRVAASFGGQEVIEV